ncbi:NUDIX domain-containing protein [Nocardioides sp.]|uniref:NUDIX domain-containing protein n=1 Tax=Nocardioides sp. TaxID=35761 RepID=UPI0027337992|nr:NUDIX hydrolase [Nocardioides sp.]MDP3892883.1 NUDIX hydrolase [Nocardioides sp.]
MPITGDAPGSWPVSASVDLHRDDWVVALRADHLRRPGHPEDTPFRRLVIEHPGAAIVLALDEDDRVLCLRQYRHPAQRTFLELPAGLLDVPGEDPLEVARRELREEAGLQAAHWRHLLSVYSSPGLSEELMHTYLATGLQETDRGDFVLEHEEAEMETCWVPFEELYAAVLDGRVTMAPVALAVLAYHAKAR